MAEVETHGLELEGRELELALKGLGLALELEQV
jgi:hypothetical protein